MAPPQVVCGGCNNILKSKDYLSCSLCAKRFDLLCANISEKRFNHGMNKEQKSAWKCPECISKQPKKGNTNTPVRQGAASSQPTSSFDCSNETEVLDVSPTCSNITFRASQQPGRQQATLTLDNIREVIKQELMSIVKIQVVEELNTIKRQLSSYSESMSFISAKYEELKTCVEEKSSAILKLQSDNEKLLSTVDDLSSRLAVAEQHLRESNIEINGIPEHRSENLLNTVKQLAKTIDCPIAEQDICKITRVAKLSRDSDKPRTVILKLRNPRQRDTVLAAVINFNRKNLNNKLNSHHLGLGGPRVPVYVAEHLTRNNKALHAAARKKAKELNYKFIWVRNGRIYVRKDESAQALLVRCYDSLKLIV